MGETMHPLRLRAALAAILLGTAALGASQVREDDANYRETYAIVGARIEVGDGRVIERGTILVRNGRIAEVGQDVRVPSFAHVIKGEGLTAYPGFLDAYSTQGLRLPEPRPVQDAPFDEAAVVPSSMRAANRRGVRPELNAADHLDLSAQALVDWRRGGFTAALLAPSGGLLNGVPALVALNGRPARESVILHRFGLAIGFSIASQPSPSGQGQPQPPGYPATPLGFIAHLRQTFMDAQDASGPNAERPLAALQPALRGETPVLIDADRGFEVVRALRLADQFGLKPILVGGAEAAKHVGALKQRQVPVILTLNWEREPNPARRDPTQRPPRTEPPGRNPSRPPLEDEERTDDPVDVPSKVMEERQANWLERVRTAKILSEAGVPIALSTRGSRDQDSFWRNLRRAVSEGLPRDVALRALTLDAARLMGVDRELGTVEAGKRAHLTLMTGDFTSDASRVRYVFVDGRMFRPETDRAPSGPTRGRPQDDEEEDPHP